MSSKLVEISGQCEKCKDFFTVELIPVRRSSEKPGIKYFRPVLTPRLKYKDHTLYHRPDVCNGQVRLFGGLRAAQYTHE